MTDWNDAFAGRLEAGKCPALLLVDPVKAYVTPESPLYLDSGNAAINRLPIAWTGVRYKPDGSDGGQFFKKVPALEIFVGDSPLGEFPESLAPAADEAVFIKQYPSAFFRTSLEKWLSENGADTLFIGGFSTSGCVRASTLDALQYGFIPFTVTDACADRTEDSHRQNLRDLGAKYAEIINTRHALERLAGI